VLWLSAAARYSTPMFWRILAVLWLSAASLAFAGEARILKVLPHLLDAKGRDALSPSLFERDAYQVQLRTHPEEISALRFDVQIKARRSQGPLLLRLQMRTARTEIGKIRVVEKEIVPARFFSTWAKIELDRDTYQSLGSILAWRASLWQDGKQIAAQESFLW
jgi:hypothetical protein